MQRIAEVIETAERDRTPEELAEAAHALDRELEAARMPAQASLMLRPAA
jgi:hypothetical protein